MKIAIDINDVLRNFTINFAKYYIQHYDHTFNMDDFSQFTNDLEILFPFKTKRAFEVFTYNDYAYELFGSCPTCNNRLAGLFNDWLLTKVPNYDTEEPIEFIIVSPKEYGLSIPSTSFFLAKIGCKIREYYYPTDSLEIWDKCDVLITANPDLLNNKPEGKVAIRIEKEYNEDCPYDLTYINMMAFLEESNNIEKIIEKYGNR